MNPSKSKSPINPKKLLLLCALSVSALNAFAQVSGTYISTNNWNWGTAGNWSPATVPDAAGATANFNAVTNTALANKTIVLGGTRTIGTLNVTGAGGVNASGTLSIGNAGQLLAFNNSASDAVINLGGGITLRVLANVSASGNLQVNNNSGVVGSIVLGGTTTITGTAKFSNADPYAGITVSGRLAAAGVVKDGSGSLILSGSGNAITGNIAFNNGSIVIGNNNVLGSGAINLNGSGARRLNLQNATDRSLTNALNLSTTDLIVGREDAATASALRTLTINPAAASVSALGSGTRTLTVESLTGLAFGNNQAFSGGTLLKDGGGVLTLGGAASTFTKLQVELGTVRGFLNGNTTLGGGPSVFGAGNISVTGGNTVLEITGTNNADTLTIGNNANISLNDYATFKLSGGGLALVGGTINLNGNGILDYGAGTVTLGNTAILGASADGFNFGSNLIFTANTGITSTGTYRYNLTNSGTQILSRDSAGAVSISGTMIKTGTGLTLVDSSVTMLTLTRPLQLDAGTFDLGANAVFIGTVAIGGGDLAFGRAAQMGGGRLAFDSASTGAARLRGFDETFAGVSVGAGAIARLDLGGDIIRATTLNLGTVSFANTTGILSVAGYLPGANSDHVNLTNTLTSTQLANQVWFYGYNPGATQSGSELFTPVAGGIPDFLRVEWTSGANTMDAADYRNWRVVGSNLVNPLAVPNAPGVTVVIGNAAGEIGARTLTGANFGVTGSTWTVGNIIFDSTISSGNAQMAVDSGAGVTLVYDSGRAGVPAVIQNNRMYYPYIRGTGLLQSDLLLTGNNAMMFSQVLTGTHNVIIDKPVGTSTEIRWYGNSPNFLGDMVLQSGALYTLAGNYGLGRIIFSGTSTTNSPLLAGTTGGSSGKMHISNQLVINSNFSLSHVWIDYGGDIELTANRALTVNVETSTPGQRASVTFSGSTNLTGSGRLTKSGASAELLSGNNSFSGGLAVSSGILYTTVGANGLTIGRLDAGKNYLGTGSISVAGGGSLRVDTQGYATTVSGVTGSDAIINLSSAFMSFDNGGLVTLGTNSRVIGNNTDAAQLRVSGSLVLDGVQFGNGGADSARNVVLNLDTTTNPDGLRVTKGVNGSATVGGLRQIVKTGAGQATLDSALTFTIGGSVILNGGVLRLTGNNQITHYDTSLTDILLNGGGLGVEGTTQNFDTLHLFGNGGSLLLGADGKLTFANAGSGASWLTTGLLSIQNTSGVWNANGSGAFVRFANNPNLSTLDNISFTGYEAGVQVTSTNGYYYLLPSADALATVEWSGGGANTQWSLGTNWLTGSAPNAVDASVSVKDIDQNLATKTIDVNSAYTLSRLNVTSVQTAVTLGGSGTLIFNRSGTGAASRILHDGGSILTVGSAVDLRTNVELSANVPTGAGYVKWTGAVGGSGGFTKTGAGTLLLLNKDNTYSGGFDWLDSSRIQLGGASAASFGGAWFGTGTLTIGDGDASENFYLETYNAQLAAGSVTTANTSRTVSNNFVLRGNLIHQFQSDLGVTLSNSADFQSYIYFNGNGVIGTLDDEGKEFIVSNVGGSTARTTPGTVIIFAGNLTGYANLVQDGNGTVYYRGDNSGFLGNFIFQHGQAYVGKNQALGSGTAIFRSNSTYDAVLRSENATAANPIVLSNPFVWDGNAFGLFGYFNLNLNSAATGQYSVVNAPVVHMKGSGVATFGKDHVITGSGRLTFGQEGSYGNSGTTRFLGANTFSGGVTIGSGAVVQAGRDSVVVDGTLVSGAFGTGTLLFVSQNVGIGAYVGADSVNPNATSIRVSNPISLNYNKFGVVNNSGGGALPMLILDTGSIALRQGKGDLTIDIATGTTNVLRIESLLYDRDVSTPGGITKTGAGVLELANLNNEISAGVEAQAGVVRARVSGASVSVGSHAPGASVFGTGEWLTKTASGAGNAGAFEIAADTAGATVTLTGSNAFVLNDNGQLRVTGSNITTVLASGGYLVSTDTAGQEGSIVADLVKTTNYTLGVKMAAKNWQLDAGTVNLARANLTNSAGTITFQAGSVLNVNHNVQTLSNLVVEGNATIDVSGGLPSNPVIVTIGTVTVNTGLLTFSGWQGDIPTGKGSTIVQSTLNVGTVVRGVSLDSGIEQAIVRRNIDGVSVLIPYDLIFTWDGQAGNNLWEVKDWSKNGTHSDIEQPDGVTATAIFNTDAANLSGQSVNLSDNRRVGTLNFTGATKVNYTLSGAGYSILLDSGVSGAETFITNDGASDVTLNTNFQLVYYAPDGENLQITQNGSGNLFFNGQISGPDSTVTVSGSGAGAVIFSGNNTFSKEFILSSGLVWLGANSGVGNGPLGGGLVTLRGGTLRGVTSGGTAGADRTLANDYHLDGGFTLAGANTLTLAGNGAISQNSTVNTGSGSVTLGAAGKTLTVSGSQQLTTVGAVTVNGGVALSGTLETNTNSGTATVNATVTGAGQLTKTGSGTLLLTGSNTSTGGFVLAEGVTGINNNNALGTGPLTLGAPASPPATVRLDTNALNLANNVTASGGTIDTQTNTGTLSGTITGATGFTKAGSGTLTVTQSNSYTGTTNLSAGAVVATNADALGASAVVVSSSLTLAFNNATYDNATSGSGNITVSGSNIRVDSAANTTTGTWHVAGSALINDATDLGPSSKVNLTGTLTTDGNNNLTFSNTLTGAGVINFTGSGTHGFAAATGTNFTGTARANGGLFDWNPGASTALKKATLETVSGKTLVNSGTQSAAKLIMHGGTTQFTGTAYVTDYTISATSSVLFDLSDLSSRSLLQQDEPVTNTLIVATNNWTGSLNDLRLVTASGAVLGTTSTLAVGSGTEALGVYSNTLGKTNNTLTLGYALQELKLQTGKTLTLSGDTTGAGAELHALISGAGNLQINATNAITLNTAETFTGTLTVSSGTLVAGVADVVISSTRLIVNSAFALNGYNQTVNNLSGAAAGRVLLGSNTLTLNTTTSSTYAGSITGAGVVVKSGAATQTLSGSSNYSGGTRLNSGTLRMTNANALGSGTAAVAATLVTEFTGTLANNLTGSGTVRAVSGANVTLGGNNTNLTGLLDILAGGQVTARAAANVGGARLAVGGTFIADNSAAWALTNTLSGAGVLLKQNTGNLAVNQANTAFTGTAGIVGGTLTLGHLQGVGTAAIADNAVLQLSGLSGTLANNISGTGNVDINTSAVTLSGSNTLSGTFQVAAGSNLKAINQYSLGTGKVTVSGTLTLGAPSSPTAWTLNPNTTISGPGQLVKEDANTVTISHSNSYTGGSVIRAGELNLANLNGLGSGNINNSAALRLSANNGLFANNVSGSGTVHVSGSGINLTGTNTVAAWRVTGSGTVSGTANLGAGALFLDGGVLNFTPANNASVTLANALTGHGALVVTLGGNTSQWNFASTTGATFTGTLNMRKGEYQFSTADRTGAGALKQATLMLSQVDTNNVGSANLDQNYTIGSLNLNGGVLKTTITGSNTASGTLTVTNLLSAAGGGQLQAHGLDVTGLTGTVAAGQNFFADSGNANRYQIEVVKATGTAQGTQLTLVDGNGAVIGSGADVTRRIADGSGTAHYNYAATLGTRADGEQGLFIGYGLTELQANSGTQVLLSNGTTTAVLDAKLTGGGGFRIAGGAAVASIGNAASSYTGTTSVVSGTVRLTADNGFGWSSLLELAAATRVDLNNVTQNIGGLDVAANASLRIGADGSLAVNNLLGAGDAVNAGLLDADGGRLGVSGNLTNSGTVLGGAANPAAVTVGGTLTNSGRMDLSNRSLTAGAYTGSANAALTVGGTLTVNGLLANSGTLTVGQLAAATQVVNQGLLSGAGAGDDTIGGNLVNSGTVDLAARALAVGGAYTGSAGSALTVASGSLGGAATVGAHATVSAGTLAVVGAIVNSGSIRANQLTAQAAYTGSAGSTLNLNGGAAEIAGPLTVAAGGQILLGANGSLSVNGGGALAGDGALSGSGTLRVSGNNQLLTVSGSNAVALLVSVDATDTLELRHLAALGGSGTVTTSGTLRLAGVNGAFALDLAGAGNVSATDAAGVILTGSNSFSGTWAIAADSGLKAVSANSLGSGRVTVSGTLTLGAPSSSTADWALNSNNTISGNGKLVKEDNNTVTVSHSNSYSGGSVITSGELNLANLNGLGTGNVANSAALRLSANNGVFTNNLSGAGVTILSGSGVTVSGSNSLFTGTWNVTGSGTMSSQQNLGAVGVTAVNISGDLSLLLGAIDYDFNQPLSGSGTLTVNNTGTLNFTGNTGGAFTGNVVLQHNQFALDGNNTAALAHATLTVGEGNHTVVGSGPQQLANLTLQSGTIGFTLAASGTAAAGLVNTGTLSVSAAAVVVINTGSFNNGALPLLRQDEQRDIQLVAATALGAGSVTQITGANLLDQDGNQLTDATQKDIVQGGAVTAGGTYDFAAMVSGSGLYLGYELTALELLAGQTTVLDNDLANAVLAGADELHARVSGSGNLQISASNSITLNNGANNYTGATLVTGGTLIVGHSGALGDTALLELAADTTADLNGHSQTVGAFNGSAGSTLNLNGGELTISGSGQDSVSAGLLTGSGTLGVADASFTVSGSNRLGGLVDIAAAAVVVLDDAGGLGASEIALGGSLVLSATNSGELVNTLSGSGALVQQGGETVTIAQANDSFGGTVRVQGGALALEHVAGVGTAEVTIEQGGVLAYRNASGTLQNNVSGEGELVILSSSLTVTDERTVEVALVSLAAGSVTLDSTNIFGRQIAVDADSQVLLARDGAQLGHVTNHGLISFGDGSGGFKTARVGDLSGGGVIVLNVNIAAQQGDLLQTGAVSGTHGLVFNRLDGPGGVTGKEKILLIETAGGGAFVSGTLQDGMFQYTVLDGAGNPNLDGNANNWWLMGNGLSTDGRVILSVAGASSLGWFAQQDSLLQRLGGLRLDYEQLDGRSNLAKHGAGDVWVRAYGQQVNAGGGASGAAFQDTLWGTDIGADKLWQLDANNMLYTGVFGGYGQSSLEFRRVSASAESNNYQGGVYATWLHDTGWYADWVAKAAYLDNSFETFDLSGKNRGEYNNWAAGTSVEVGRKIQLPDSWFIEPQAQLSYVHVFGADYSTRGVSDLAVSQADADILQGRLGALFGKTIVLNNRGILQPYAKAMAVGQTSSGGTVTASSGGAIQGADGRWRPNYDGLRAQFGAGIIWQLDEQNQLHLDYQAEFGDKFDQPWGVNAGYRYQF